ncbi:MAG: VapC toxin family PIN domain ribonuclease [Verrucomicrobia bacterium]|nr:VapC toxin family PIN domain ribonuclease [Verrucomicrobiota bacterium]
MSTSPTWLLDGNVLLGINVASHVHHARAIRWFDGLDSTFASCATTQGTLLRLHMQFSADPSPTAAWAALHRLCALPHHRFWDDSFSYLEIDPTGLLGHRQITDAWLAHLARRRGGRVATLDTAFATAHPDVATLI